MLLVVTIGIVFLARNFFLGLKNFAQSYMGDYVTCLMTHGELPALGIQNDDLKKNTETGYVCASQFSFSLQAGFQENGNGGNRNNNSAGTSKGASSKAKGGQSTKPTEDGATSGASESAVAARERNRKRGGKNGLSGGAGDSDSGGSIASARRMRRSTVKTTTDGGSDDAASSESKSGRVVGEISSGGYDSAGSRGRSRYRAVTGQMQEQLEKNSKVASREASGRRISSQIVAQTESGQAAKRSQISMDQLQPKPPPPEEEIAPGFGVGALIKWAIIIVLGIALFILVGGQVMNYSNSDGT